MGLQTKLRGNQTPRRPSGSPNRTLLLCPVSGSDFKSGEFAISEKPSPHSAKLDEAAEELAIAHGIELFNSRKFFDAHEAWEAVWLTAAEPDKRFLQGLIQISAAFHHHSRGNRLGMESLLRAGLLKIEHAPPVHRGMKIDAIRAAAREWLKAIEKGGELEPHQLPQIERNP